MRKLRILLVTGVISCWISSISAQSSKVITENFDGNISTFTSSSASAWKKNTDYYVSTHNSIRGIVPNMVGDITILTSPVYDFSNYQYVLLRFSHICKISPQDIVRIEYRLKGTGWQPLQSSSYMGKAMLYQSRGFSSNSYTDWEGNDSLALPLQSWWKGEIFDVSFETGTEDEVQFRFIIQHGVIQGTQISYGWLIDNIEIIASTFEVELPVVEFVTPLVKDTIYSTGPYEINTKVKTTSNARIENPLLNYTATQNGIVIANDSVLMTMVQGDSLWKATIPQFVLGTQVVYFVTGKDTTGNTTMAASGYVIAKPSYNYGDTSIALTSIDSPVRGQVTGGVNMPVSVTIRNKGDSSLTSAIIYQSINGVVTSYPWTGNLAWDFEQQVSLGIYSPRIEGYDTIVIWVNNPNGIFDSVREDDTLSVITYGCAANNMSGIYTVGQDGMFSTLQEALTILSYCSVSGDITLALESGVYPENTDLSNSVYFMGNYTLTITSLANHRDSVILRPASGVGITLANSNNVVLKDITVDAAVGGTYAIQFTGACTNIVVKDCKLLANQTGTTAATGYAGIYKATAAGSLVNMSIIHNTIQGGYYGIYLYGASANYCQNITIDSNIINNQYYYAAYFYYINFNSVSYNQISPRSSNQGTTWYGLYFYYARNGGNIIGNRIRSDNSGITSTLYGMRTYYIDSALVANNEIYLNSSASTTYGVYWYTPNGVNYLHNTVLLTGTGGSTFMAAMIYVSTSVLYSATYKNNIFVANGGITPYAIYLSAAPGATFAQYNYIDYNNYYSSGNLGYAGGVLMDLAEWQPVVTTDNHSASRLPAFVNITNNLELWDYTLLSCNLIPDVSIDIRNANRRAITVMGCYEESLKNTDGVLVDILGLRKGNIITGETDTIKVIFINGGNISLNAVNLGWSINGTIQPSKDFFFNMPLTRLQRDTIVFDTMAYPSGNFDIKIWINHIEGGTLSDEYLLNDTVSASVFICSDALTGIIPVSDTSTFSTITAAIQAVFTCGVGDITLLLDSGVYQENCDFSNLHRDMRGNTLTVISKTGNANDVIIKPISGTGIILFNTSNLTLKAITVDVTSGISSAIQFAGACTNILVRDCKLLANPITTNTSSYVVSVLTPGIADSIFFINNLLDGGGYGFSFRGGIGTEPGQYGTNIVFDSNIVSNQYRGSVSLSYINLTSCSYNAVLSRVTNTNSQWDGIQITYVNGPVIGNRIIQRSDYISFPQGMIISNHNFYPTSQVQDRGLIANNEIIIFSNAIPFFYASLGIYVLANTRSKIINNSILGKGNSFCIYIYASLGGQDLIVKNNNIVTDSYTFYFNGTYDSNFHHIDYNNLYSYYLAIAYYGGMITTLAAWQQIITTDSHSVSILPNFIDSTVSLELSNYDSLQCNLIPDVITDIQGHNRNTPTVMGCYEEILVNANGALEEILNLRKGTIIDSETDSIKIRFTNRGTTPLNSVNLGWSINGVSQTPKEYFFNTPLTRLQSNTINLGLLTYASGNFNLKIWINSLEGGALLDEYPLNDTISASVFVCPNAVTGVIPISDTSNFSTITAALQAILTCGVGDITLLLDSGTYQENCDFSNINRYMPGNRLTIISKTGNADDVIIKPASGSGIILSNTRNLMVKAITVDVTSGTEPAILFIGACTNIVVRDCKLLANPTTTNLSSAAVYKSSGTGIADSIFFISNLLDGGYSGFYFVGGEDAAALRGTNIVFDSNMVTNSYYYGTYPDYSDFISCSHNTILSRITNAGATWYGLRMYYSHGPLIGNRIIQRSTDITSPYGIYTDVYNVNYTGIPVRDRALIANNEIILNTTGAYYGIYMDNYSRAEIIHNSIYISGSGAARGIYIVNSAGNSMAIKSNNIVLENSIAYPIYFYSTANLNLHDIDYNNLYAPQYVGYCSGNITTVAAWRQAIPTDKHSVRLYPDFIDNTISLELSNYFGLSSPLHPRVARDIAGYFRNPVTVMGAYNGLGSSLDLSMQQVLCKDTSVLYPQPVPVKIEIANTGSGVNINNAIFGWSVNGIVQPSYTWTASNPLNIGDNIEVQIGSFSAIENTNIFDIVVWVENVNGIKDSVNWNDTAQTSIKVLWTGNDLSLQSIEQLVPDGVLCTDAYTSVKINVENIGTADYDFAINPATFSIRVTNPVSYSLDTVISTGEIKSGEITTLELTDMFPIMVAGVYDIEISLNSPVDTIKYDDTIRNNYISGRFSLPIDEDFSSSIPIEFNLNSNTLSQWQVIPQGTGADTAINPQFGTGMLAFEGNPGSMTTLSTQQLDLSSTVQPSLSFWYFHDTIPCEDYTDVRITVDGGATYNTLFSLTKYNPVYGWQQYSMDLPGYAVNQCVILLFESMEKSRSGNVTQYIDRILITAKQDIAISKILTSPLAACDLQNKEVKVVLSNLTDPVLDFTTTPVTVSLEIKEMGQIYTHVLDSGSLGRFASDTITIATGVNFTKGTYTLKAYFSSVLDVDRMNDTLVIPVVINPALSVSVHPESSPANCLTGELVVNPTITLYNTGNMDLSGIDMILQVDTGDNNIAVYALLKGTYANTILAGDTATYMFDNSYTVPWNARYNVRAYAYLSCDSALANNTIMITECVDTKDLRIISIDNPSGAKDAVGNTIQVTATLNNRSDGDIFTDIPVNVRITNSQGIEQETFMETQTIGASATVSHVFTRSYTVPNDTVYYLTVFVNSQDNYRDNDSLTMKRYTESVGIETLKGSNAFTLGQNIPNPANNRTRIDYNIPESGKVVFYVHSVSGQLLYSQTIEAASGKQSLELNTSTFAVGIYIYSIEYKGQRLVKRMMISD